MNALLHANLPTNIVYYVYVKNSLINEKINRNIKRVSVSESFCLQIYFYISFGSFIVGYYNNVKKEENEQKTEKN